MRATASLLAPGFFQRSLDELRRIAISAIKQEGLKGAQGPYDLLDFRKPEILEGCKTMSDADQGGLSKVALDFVPQSHDDPAHAHFHGIISTQIPPQNRRLQRSGYAAWRSRDRPPTIVGRSVWNMDPYAYLGLRVKSDGRKYFVNIQTDTIVHTDIHQHRLYAKRPGEWETIFIQWHDFVRTNHGSVVEPQGEMRREKMRSIGIGLTDRVPGPFSLRVSEIWATNDGEVAQEDVESKRPEMRTWSKLQKSQPGESKLQDG